MPSNASAIGAELDLKFCTQMINLSTKPVIIAGGINAGNVGNILMRTGADFIDVMTGVENSPGEKDAESLSRLLTSVSVAK